MKLTQKHQQARFLLIRAMITGGMLVLAQTAWCGQVDSEKIDLILRDITFVKTNPNSSSTPSVADHGLLSVQATIQTRRLSAGTGVKDWDEKNPKWKPIHDRIRADLEKDLPTLPADAAAAYAEYSRCDPGKCYEQEIASNLQPADVDAILAYFDTTEGKRFQAFQQQICSIVTSGILFLAPPSLSQTAANRLNGQDSQAESTPLSAEQSHRFLRMLLLSILFQSTKAAALTGKSGKQDVSDDGVVFSLELRAAINRNRTKLADLDLQYRDNLPGFEAFTGTDASRHLIEAMGKASAKTSRRASSALAGLQGIANKHQQEWRVLFKAELSQ